MPGIEILLFLSVYDLNMGRGMPSLLLYRGTFTVPKPTGNFPYFTSGRNGRCRIFFTFSIDGNVHKACKRVSCVDVPCHELVVFFEDSIRSKRKPPTSRFCSAYVRLYIKASLECREMREVSRARLPRLPSNAPPTLKFDPGQVRRGGRARDDRKVSARAQLSYASLPPSSPGAPSPRFLVSTSSFYHRHIYVGERTLHKRAFHYITLRE